MSHFFWLIWVFSYFDSSQLQSKNMHSNSKKKYLRGLFFSLRTHHICLCCKIYMIWPSNFKKTQNERGTILCHLNTKIQNKNLKSTASWVDCWERQLVKSNINYQKRCKNIFGQLFFIHSSYYLHKYECLWRISRSWSRFCFWNRSQFTSKNFG